MQEIATEIKIGRLPAIYQEMFQRFDEKEEQIYNALKKPKPIRFFYRNVCQSMRPLAQEYCQRMIKEGVIVARLYSSSNPSAQSVYDEESLVFRGSCFLISEGIFVCCSHQVEVNKKHIIRTINVDNTRDVEIVVKQVHKNPLGKRKKGETTAWEYAFLAVELNETTKKMFKKTLENLKLAFIEEKPSQRFSFMSNIYGYLDNAPSKFKQQKTWSDWTVSQLVESTGNASFQNEKFCYTNKLSYSFEGAPIVISSYKYFCIVGIHSKGLSFLDENQGFLFGKQFFGQLAKFKKKVQRNAVSRDSLDGTVESGLLPLSSLVYQMQLIKQVFAEINNSNNQAKQIEFIGKILQQLIQEMVKFEESQLTIEKMSLQNVFIPKKRDLRTVLYFTRLMIRDNTERVNQLANLKCLADLCEETLRLTGVSAFINDCALMQKPPLLLIVLKALQRATTRPLSKRNFWRIIAYMQAQIAYVQYGQKTYGSVEKFFAQGYENDLDKNFYNEGKKQREFKQIISLENFRFSRFELRQKFLLLFKYSVQRVTRFSIMKIYMLKLSLLYHQFRKALKFCSRLFFDDMKAQQGSRIAGNMYFISLLRFLSKFESFRNRAPAFTFFYNQFEKQAEEKLATFDFSRTKERYQQMLNYNNLKVSEQLLTALVENEVIFYNCYYWKYWKLMNELQLDYYYEKGSALYKKLYSNSQSENQEQLDNCILSYDHSFLKQRPVPVPGQTTFNILQTKIFQQMLTNDESIQDKSAEKILQKEQQERKFNQFVDLFVEVQDMKGFLQGEGFVIKKQLSFFNFLQLIKEDPIKQCVKKMFVTIDHFLLHILGKIIRLNSVDIYLRRLTLNDIVFSPDASADILLQNPPISVLYPTVFPPSEQYVLERRSCQQVNKSSYCEFITELSSKEFLASCQPSDSLIEESILVKQMSLVKCSRSLSDYYLHHLEGKYSFDKRSCSLKPNQFLHLPQEPLQKMQFHETSSQSKLQFLFKQLPFRYVVRLNSVRSTFRNIDKEIQEKLYVPRSDFLRECDNDASRLIALFQAKCDQNSPYWLANRMIQEGIRAVCALLDSKQGKKTQLVTNYAEQKDIQLERDSFLPDFHRYLRHLASFSSMSPAQIDAFVSRQLFCCLDDRRKAETWSLIANIIELHEFFN